MRVEITLCVSVKITLITHTCQKHTLRVEVTLGRVEITVVSVVIIFTYSCVLKSKMRV
jgi:hypothetical protein